MNVLKFNYDGRDLALTADGQATAVDSAGATATGTWTSQSGFKLNRLEIQVPGLGTVLVDVGYAFNASNQLELTVPPQDKVLAASPAAAFAGRIEVDDPQDLEYVCIDPEGEPTGFRIFAYGTFRFDQKTDRLYFAPTGQPTETEIIGLARTGNNVVADISTRPNLVTLDLLKFKAATLNRFGSKIYVRPATIEFVGTWDFYDDKLVFVANYDSTTPGKPSTFIAFGGSVRGVNTSLVYSDGPDGQILFNIASAFQINRTSGEWEAALGYANKTLRGSLSLKTRTQIGEHGRLDLAGTLNLKQASGRKLALDLQLKARYESNGANIFCWVEYDCRTVEILLEGTVKVGRLGDVEFEVKYAPGNPQEKLRLKLGNYKSDAKLRVTLEVILGRKGAQLAVGASYRLRWEDGVQVPA